MATLKKFPNIRRFAWNSSKKQEWETAVQRSASGRVRTMTNQLYPKWTISAQYNAITDAEARELLGFVALLKGSFEPFLWLDPEDYKATGVQLAPTSGYYQCLILIGSYAEPAEYIENLKVYVNGIEQDATAYTVDRGAITFKTPLAVNAEVTADYIYYWKVLLNDDGLTITKAFDNINKCSLKMVVAR